MSVWSLETSARSFPSSDCRSFLLLLLLVLLPLLLLCGGSSKGS
jgi:hypothetical protein